MGAARTRRRPQVTQRTEVHRAEVAEQAADERAQWAERVAEGVIGHASMVPAPRDLCRWLSQGRTSSTMLNGVSATCANRVKPASAVTPWMRAGPACVPSASPTGCDSDEGVHSSVEKP